MSRLLGGRNLLIGFSLVAAIQLAVPTMMIGRHELTLSRGNVYRIKTQPIDPYDAFRGRYVMLSLPGDAPSPGGSVSSLERIFVQIEEGPDGFATFPAASRKRPTTGDSIRVRVMFERDGRLHFRLPFDRYYMQEDFAPRAESLARDGSRQGEQNAFVTVRVRNGFAVLEELYVDDTPITELVQRAIDSEP